MTPAQEKALWDFVRVSAKCALHSGPGGYELLADEHRTAARTLLSVLAEEAPPAPTQREIQMRAGTMVSCKRCGHRNYYVDPERGVPCYCGAAPAPKQERGVEDVMNSLRSFFSGTSFSDRTIRGKIMDAERVYREEKAEREKDRAAMLSTYGEIQTLGHENAALRERVEKARELHRKRHLGHAGDCLSCDIIASLEGKGEGTEATK